MANNKNRDASADFLVDEKIIEVIKNVRQQLAESKEEAKKIAEYIKSAFNEEFLTNSLNAALGIQKQILTLSEREYFNIQTKAKALTTIRADLLNQKNIAENILASSQKNNKLSAEQLVHLKKIGVLQQDEYDKAIKLNEETQEYKDLLIKVNEELVKVSESTEETLENIEKQVKELHNLETTWEKVRKAEEKVAGVGAGLAKTMFGISGHADSIASSMALWVTTSSKMEKAGILDRIRADFQNKLTLQNFAIQAAQKGEELIANAVRLNLDYYNNQQRMFQETGMQRKEYEGTMNSTVDNLHKLSITSDEALSSIRSLYSEMNVFSESSETVRGELAESTAALKRLGVQESTNAKALNELNKVMKIGTLDSKNITEQMTKFAVVLGKDTNKVISDLSSNMNHLSRYSAQEMIKVFKELQIVSKNTGTEINSLIGFAKGFDTFESAAEKVGGLNTLLKGPFLNTMQFINETDPAKRIEMVAKALNDAGKSFETMGYYEKDALAERLGMSTEEAAKVFGNQSKGIDSITNSLNKQADALGSVKDIAEGNSTIEQRTRAFEEQAAGITTLNDNLSSLISSFSGFTGKLVTAAIYLQVFTGLMAVAGTVSAFLKTGKKAETIAEIENTAAKTTNSIATTQAVVSDRALTATIQTETVAVRSATMSFRQLAAAKLQSAKAGMMGKGKAIGGGLAGLAGMGLMAAGQSGAFGEDSGMNSVASIGGGALTGAMSMAGGGPWAMLAGGVIGGLMGMFAEGTDSSPAGLALVGEKGPEIVSLPGNSSVINNSNTSKIIESSYNIKESSRSAQQKDLNLNIVVKLDEDVLAKFVKRISGEYLEDNVNVVVR